MSDKLTKKDLQAKIEELEAELKVYKNKTQLARNYSIVENENCELKKQLGKKMDWWRKKVEDEQVLESDEESE